MSYKNPSLPDNFYLCRSISCSKYFGIGLPDFTAIAICFSRNLLITDFLFFGTWSR